MKIGKQYLGKLCSVQWMDPSSSSRRVPLDKVKTGRGALATWVEYGVIHDITDGVVIIIHSAASDAGKPEPPEGTDEVEHVAVPEALIEKITVFAPVPNLEEARDGKATPQL